MDEREIAAGQVFQLTIRHPDGSTQQLDILAHLVELFGRDAEIPMASCSSLPVY